MVTRNYKSSVRSILIFSIVCALLVVALLPALTQAAPPALPPRPEPEGGDDDDDNGGGPQPGPQPSDLSAIHGLVLNWGNRNEPDAPLTLRGGGWSKNTQTDDNGYYLFDNLGAGVAILNVQPPPGLKSATPDVGLYLDGHRDYEVNLVCYGGEQPPQMPLAPTMTADRQWAEPTERVNYRVEVVNSLGYDLGDTLISVLMPPELVNPVVSTDRGVAQVWDNLAWVDVGWLRAGESVNVTIQTDVLLGARQGQEIETRATLIYAGGLAAPSSAVVVTVGQQPE